VATISLRPRVAKSASTSRTWERIYAVVRRIPRGRVATYGQVSALAGFPRAPRLAGYALHALPHGSPLPWHRVVAAGGKLSLARLSLEGALTQRLRLEKEGVRFDPRGRVRLKDHGWSSSRRKRKPRPAGRGSRIRSY
jgi:methylated-DNA-protein-cysteine methyltransferase-like protein